MTSPNESGPRESLARLDDRLDAFEQSIGVPGGIPGAVQSRCSSLLLMEPEQLHRMDASECGEAACSLLQLAWHLQKSLNRERSRMTWADEAVKRCVASRVGKVPGSSYEERRHLVLSADERARQIEQVRMDAVLRVERLNGLAARVDALARALLSLQSTRRHHD